MTEPFRSKIAIDKNICHGKPHIIGTRIMVHQVLDLLAADATIEEIIEEDFPDLTRDDILACIAYANKLVRDEEIEIFTEEEAEVA
jgi:uncharacterized protein (DUF433 family)